MIDDVPHRPPVRVFAGWALIGLAVVVLVAAVGSLLARPGGVEAEEPTFRLATETFTNEEGGYSFRYPPGWEVEAAGTATRVRSPQGETVVSFGIGPEGNLGQATATILRQLAETYRDISLSGIDAPAVAGSFSAMAAGTGTNEAGLPIRYLVLAIAAPERNYAITVFTAGDADPGTVFPPTQEIVSSFQTTA